MSEQWRNRMVGDAEVDPRELIPNPSNWRRHPAHQRKALEALLGEIGWVGRVLVNRTTGHVVDGHARYEQALDKAEPTVPVTYVELTENEEKLVLASFDPIGAMAETDSDVLGDLLDDIETDNPDIAELLAGMGPAGGDNASETPGSLVDTFGVPPFSVLDTRQGYWQDRKRIWRNLIQDKGESRQGTLGDSEVMMKINDGVSILDPVLAELMVAWFGTRGGIAFDPFAGDTVFGYVAAKRGMRFRGIELREEQARLNQGRCDEDDLDATYFHDDSSNMDQYIEDESVDLMFSCPPYADLEQYSDDPRDLSNMSHEAFFAAYSAILGRTYSKLKPDRFAVIVTSEVRDSTGGYICIVPKTIAAMEAAGYRYYNELILVGVGGTLPLRAPRVMRATRKVGRQHQYALVFAKGDPEKAATVLAQEAVAEYQATKRTTANHETVLVFAKGDPRAAAQALGEIDMPMPVEAT